MDRQHPYHEHLAGAVLHLERVHAAGCTFGSLLSIRDREQFVSLTAEAEQALDDIDPRDYDLDAIAFVVRALPEGLAAILIVADDTTLTANQVKAMVGSTTT